MIVSWLAALALKSVEEREVHYHYDHALAFANGIAQIEDINQPKNIEEKQLRYQAFQYHVFQMEWHGLNVMKKEDVDSEKAYLHRYLYTHCMRTAENRFKKSSLASFDFDRVISDDPDVQFAGRNFFQAHFKNSSLLQDDLKNLKEILTEKISFKDIYDRFTRGNLNHTWQGLICYFGSCSL